MDDILGGLVGSPTATAATPTSDATPGGDSGVTNATEATPDADNTDTAPVSNTDNSNTDTDSSTPTETDDSATTPEYTNVVGTFASIEEAEASGQFERLLTSKAFADEVSVRNVMAGKGAAGLVPVQNVYNAEKGKRNPLPVVLVDGTVYLPMPTALEVWDSRPERGEGTSTTTSGRLEDADLARLTFKAQDTLERDLHRLEVLQGKIERSRKIVEKRENQAKARFGDDWQAVVDKAGEDADASKEIADDTDSATPAPTA